MALENQTIIPLDQIIWEDNGGEEDPKSLLIASLKIGTLDIGGRDCVPIATPFDR